MEEHERDRGEEGMSGDLSPRAGAGEPDEEGAGEVPDRWDEPRHAADEFALDGEEELEDVGEEDRSEGSESISVEISGLSLYTHHGVSAAEREVGQRLVLDVRLELGEVDATATDRIEDTVDYAEVCQLIALIVQQRSHRTLERLSSRIADRLLSDYRLEAVWVKIAKPEPPIPLPVDEVSVEIWRERAE